VLVGRRCKSLSTMPFPTQGGVTGGRQLTLLCVLENAISLTTADSSNEGTGLGTLDAGSGSGTSSAPSAAMYFPAIFPQLSYPKSPGV